MNFKALAPHAARAVLGLVFAVFGLNHLLHFLPTPPLSAPAAKLAGAFVESGYLMGLVGLTEVVCGALLLSNRLVPLALVVLAPVMVNIVAFHAFLEPPQTLVMPLVLMGLQLFLAWTHRAAYAPLFRAPARSAQTRSQELAGAV